MALYTLTSMAPTMYYYTTYELHLNYNDKYNNHKIYDL